MCFVSYPVDDYLRVLEHALHASCSIVVVHRDPFKRAISLEISKELTRQTSVLKATGQVSPNVFTDGYSNALIEGWEPFRIEPEEIKSAIFRYMESIKQVLKWLDRKKVNYYFLKIEDLHAKMSVQTYEQIFVTLGLQVSDLPTLIEVVNYRPISKNQLVLNLSELKKTAFNYSDPVPKNANFF